MPGYPLVKGRSVRRYERLLIAAVIGGALLAGLPIVIVERVVHIYVDQQSRGRLEQGAHGALALAETRVEQAMVTLVDLGSGGIESCTPEALQAMRRAVFTNGALKEVAILDAEGNALCNHIGGSGETRATSSEQALFGGRYTLALVRFRDHSERALRLSLKIANGGALTALISGETLLPATEEGSPRFRLLFTNGEVIAARPVGEENAPSAEGLFVSVRAKSSRFPIAATSERARAAIADEYEDVLLVARLTPTIVSFFVIAFSWLAIRRSRTDPTAMLSRALDAGEIIPYFQPIVDITNGRLLGAEVLARWRRPDGTIILPGAFLSHAEHSDLIYELTRILMRKARDEVREAFQQRPHLKLSFNLDGGHFLDGHIIQEVKQTFAGSGIAFDQLIFEVTEREPVADLAGARGVISELQRTRLPRRHRRRRHRPRRPVISAQARRRLHQDRQDVHPRHRHRALLENHHRDPGGARPQHERGGHRRRRGDLRTNRIPARPRHHHGPGLRVRAAIAGVELPGAAWGHGSAPRRRGQSHGVRTQCCDQPRLKPVRGLPAQATSAIREFAFSLNRALFCVLPSN